jgi:ribonuclease-3
MNRLQKELAYNFKNINLLQEALVHKSYKKDKNNERLEFLGDAVLDLIVGEYLFIHLPNASEGEMSKIRASLVNEGGFSKMAKAIKLDEFILLSKAEENNNGRNKPSILSNAFEAVVGAMYLDGGIENVKNFVNNLLERLYPKITLQELFQDYKTSLQEITQAKFGVIPEYFIKNESGPDHDKEFEVELKINGKTYATAKGKSKKQAQQAAAKKAIKLF